MLSMVLWLPFSVIAWITRVHTLEIKPRKKGYVEAFLEKVSRRGVLLDLYVHAYAGASYEASY